MWSKYVLFGQGLDPVLLVTLPLALVAVEDRLLQHERDELQVRLRRPLQIKLVIRSTDRVVGGEPSDVLQLATLWRSPDLGKATYPAATASGNLYVPSRTAGPGR